MKDRKHKKKSKKHLKRGADLLEDSLNVQVEAELANDKKYQRELKLLQ